MDWTRMAQEDEDSVVGSCKHNNDPLGYITFWEFLVLLSNCWLLVKLASLVVTHGKSGSSKLFYGTGKHVVSWTRLLQNMAEFFPGSFFLLQMAPRAWLHLTLL